MMSAKPSPSRKKLKSAQFFKSCREADRKLEQLGLSRPQDEFEGIKFRTRSINMGKIVYDSNPNSDAICESKLQPYMMKSNPKRWTCYSGANENSTPAPVWISTTEDFETMIKALLQCTEITIDVECHNHHSLKGFITLIQIGTFKHGDFLIDPFTLHNEIKIDLKYILEAPFILKIGHDLRNDSKWLQRDFDIFLVQCVDIQVLYGLSSEDKMVSLKSLFQKFYPELQHLYNNDTYSDWRLRPGKGMTQQQETYAVNDVHIALRICDQLRHQASEMELIEAFEITKSRLFVLSSDVMPSPTDGPNFTQVALDELRRSTGSKTGTKWAFPSLEVTQMNILVSLLEWRHSMSQTLDESPDNVVKGFKLIEIARLQESNVETLRRILGKTHTAIVGTGETLNQINIIQRLIETGGTYIEDLRSILCHYCLQRGHGPGWTCSFPKLSSSLKTYMHKPENQHHHLKQQQRRYENLKKYGKKHADRQLAWWRTANRTD